MAYLPKIEFANFHLKFGDTLNLLDLFGQLVYPAVADGFTRSFRETDYWFEEVLVVQIDFESIKTPALVGRLRKRHIVEIREDDLQQEPQRLPSTESALFILLLDTHRLLYLQETQLSPGLRAFRTTVE